MQLITKAQYAAELVALGFRPGVVFLNDRGYQLFDSTWLLGEFDAYFHYALDLLGLAYEPDTWDCEDIADLYSVLGRMAHRRSAGRVVGKGLPVGIFQFLLDPADDTSGHAAVVARTRDRGILFLEPQRPRDVYALTKPQITSSWLLKS